MLRQVVQHVQARCSSIETALGVRQEPAGASMLVESAARPFRPVSQESTAMKN
ncbi:hypothetical protein NC315_34285 [Streptomyces sp. G2]|uniref:hypothetical protein n=1 Tax=Streptomyces sp. G2 TaxID=1684471 RepID=UPI00202FA429|nr:hypothetical protein [Streptomyces sp. G2]MCM1950401.1 hypothetical protein [Streptomyces sp. G2]